MGRIIELTVSEKTYTIEFNNIALYSIVDIQEKVKNAKGFYETFKATCDLVKCGLLKHHPNITDEEVVSIMESIGDLEGFIKAIQDSIEASIKEITVSKGNAHWVVK